MASLPFLVVPRSVVTAVIGFAVGVGVGYGLFLLAGGGPAAAPEQRQLPPRVGSAEAIDPHHFPAAGKEPSPDAKPVGMHPLAVGDRVPPLPAQWLNGPPPPLPPGKGKVLVVDVWCET